ncbi:DUF2939 domain-containing protein [Bradyrhizobium japonicum]|uniref:DUF2939 domain-containing protein n=1 Tax=Bradyrhizobium japonicum TaxID=375 RepID=UPI003D322DCB
MHRAAQYVRMSTDYQQYSIENQAVVGAPHEQQSRLLRLRRVATVLVRLVVYIESAFVSVPGLVSAVRNGDAAQIMARTDLPRVRHSLVDQLMNAYPERLGAEAPATTNRKKWRSTRSAQRSRMTL